MSMVRYTVPLLAILLAATPAQAVKIIGNVDQLNAAGATGWACTGNGTPVSIVVYSGGDMLGAYATTVSRQDLAKICPGGAMVGFQIHFDPGIQAAFAWQSQVTLFGIAAGATPAILPPSSKKTTNPMILPVGQLLGLTAAGNVSGGIAQPPDPSSSNTLSTSNANSAASLASTPTTSTGSTTPNSGTPSSPPASSSTSNSSNGTSGTASASGTGSSTATAGDGSAASPPAPPTVQLFANGPAGYGTAGVPTASSAVSGGGYGFEMAVPSATAAGPLMPVYGIVASPGGLPVPLASPQVLLASTGSGTQGAATVNLSATVKQRGAMSGITTTILSAWMPIGYGMAGVSGDISLTGNTPIGFSEALIILGTTADSQTTCLQENGVTTNTPPATARFWAGIVKDNGNGLVTIPVNFAVQYPFNGPHASNGVCVVALVAAGFVFLDPVTSRYTTTGTALTVQVVPLPKYPANVVPFGLGGEFRINSNGPTPMSTYIGIKANKPLALDGMAGSVSAGAVTGAPSNGPWVPAPPGIWEMDSTTYYMPASVCAAGPFKPQAANGLFMIVRNGTASALPPPAGSVPVMSMPMASLNTQVVQRSVYQPYLPGAMPAGFTGRLGVGDCLVTYESGSGSPGVLDVENQSTIYLRPVQ